MNSSIDIVLERTSILTPLFFLTIECKSTLLDILQESLCSLLLIAVTYGETLIYDFELSDLVIKGLDLLFAFALDAL